MTFFVFNDFGVGVQGLVVMLSYYLSYVSHITITDIYVIFVENFVEPMKLGSAYCEISKFVFTLRLKG